MWYATGGVVLLGAVVLVLALSPSERRRRSEMERIRIGDPADRVAQLLGEPARCPVGTLDHLRGSLPTGVPPAVAENTFATLRQQTRERWVYSLARRRPGSCSETSGQTELGIGEDQRVFWYVGISGKSTLRVPEQVIPLGSDTVPER